LSLAGLRFVQGIDYPFSSNAAIGPGEFRVLASSAVHFQQRYGFLPYGEYGGQLDNGGERISLAGKGGDTLLSVEYNDKSPWPEAADGEGYSLVAKNPGGPADPDDPQYWILSKHVHGSPGMDEAFVGVANREAAPQAFRLEQNFPNPFNGTAEIRFSVPVRSDVKIEIIDALGRRLETLAGGNMQPGFHSFKWNAAGRPSGLYFCRLSANGFTAVRRMLYLK
jgi:hypothetical protein